MGKDISVCVVSKAPETVETVERAIKAIPNSTATSLGSSLNQINGRAAKLFEKHDAIFLDMTGVDDPTLQGIEGMLKGQPKAGRVMALTDANIPLSAARELQALGIDDVLPLPLKDSDVTDAVRKVIADRIPVRGEAEGGAEGGRVVGVGRAAGGSGATTVAINLAMMLLARRGVFKKSARKSVALVDLNPQFGSAAIALDVDANGGLLAMAESGDVPDEVFTRSLVTSLDSGLDVYSAPDSPIPVDAYEHDQIVGLMKVLRASYDHVVVDLPPFVVSWQAALLGELDHLYMVSNLSVPAILNTKRMVDFFQKTAPDLDFDVVVNRDKKPTFGSRRLSDAQTVLGKKIAFWTAEDAKAAREAVDLGKPIIDSTPNSPFVKSLKPLAKSVEQLAPRAQQQAAAG